MENKIKLSSDEISYLEKRVPRSYELQNIDGEFHGAAQSINIVISVSQGNGEPYLGNLTPSLRNYNNESK